MKKLLYYAVILTLATNCKQTDKQTTTQRALPAGTMTYCAPQATDKDWYSAGTKAPKLTGLEGIDFNISTTSQEAQAYFNQGLMLSYGFNHAEAARSFFEAARLDSTCAIAYWGFAYVLGPNYNAGMEKDNYQRAYQASRKALSLSASCSEKEKALIKALTYRYAPDAPKNRSHLDSAFASAMKKVYNAYPTDPDISALYAESLMDMHPWDLYDKKTKAPRPWTPEIVTILEKLIRQHPNHPGAPHFYIHAVEASKHPERGLASANLLMSLVPGSGHLVHMPSHIYIWTGDYHLGSVANLKAVKIDSAYVTACHAQGAYPLSYYPHNYHYLSATATFEGNSALAWQVAKKVQQHTARDIMKQPGWGTLQHYFTIPYFVAVKFGLWDSLLAVKPLGEDLVYPRAVLHYAKGMAYLGRNDVPNAEKELSRLNELASNPVLKEITIWDINSTFDITQIAVNVLSAEIFRHKHEYDKAIAAFRRAIAIEDDLNYNEPPDWFFSVRHHLGAALLQAGKYAEAENVYREDLNTWKENGWALAGLYQALQKQGKTQEAQPVKTRFDKAWQYADFNLISGSSR
ncbi:tetratricopeptide repeat protein [Fibrisoma montanum]|uniref:Tetratricopeptide repeat protein n=1 Tax=Fibrisoma montanum TaxID=2305895 RepID=A0A418MAE6_9BACT|nr:tetratricopeptide repeat protein [Fibrisoma montanum]RIV23344.1 tetratricopeptide repeat protein [Fibrisoma montanum]